MNLWMSNVANNCPYSCVCSSIFHVVLYFINNIEIALYFPLHGERSCVLQQFEGLHNSLDKLIGVKCQA